MSRLATPEKVSKTMDNSDAPSPETDSSVSAKSDFLLSSSVKDAKKRNSNHRATLYSIDKPLVAFDQKFFTRMLAIVVLLAALLYICLALYSSKFNRAEVFFAECAREMIVEQNWITPLYHGQGFFDKPIFTYWLIIASFKSLGVSHFAARLPSMLASLLTIIAMAIACRKLFGMRAGLASAMALSTSFMYISFSVLCMSDIFLVLFDTLCLICFYAGFLHEKKRTFLWFLSAMSMGMGFLSKGPVAVVLPVILFIAFLATTRKLSLIKPVHFLALGGAVALLGTPWFMMAYQQNGLEAITWFFLRENFERFAGATYDTHKPIWFMTVSLLGGFAPWSIFLPFILPASIGRWRQNFQDPRGRVELFAWMWIAVVIGFFSFSRGKIDYYALPAFPACAVLVGLYLTEWIARGKKVALSGAYAFPILVSLAGIGLGIFAAMLGITPRWTPVTIALAPLSLGGAAIIMVRGGLPWMGYTAGFFGVVLVGSLYALTVMPVLKDLRPAMSYADQISHHLAGRSGADVSVVVYSGLERWVDEVTFRVEREPIIAGDQNALSAILDETNEVYLIIKDADYQRLDAGLKDKLAVMRKKKLISGSINPGFLLKNASDLTGGEQLILARKK